MHMWIGALSPKKFSQGDDDLLTNCVYKGQSSQVALVSDNHKNFHFLLVTYFRLELKVKLLLNVRVFFTSL